MLNSMNIMLRRFFNHFTEELSAQSDFLGCLQQTQNLLPHTFNGAPSLEPLTWLYSVAPCFPIRGDQIKLIYEPKNFYETLVQRSAAARERVFFASLYLGTGQLESALVQTLRRSLQQQATLRVNVLLDFTRGTRGINNSKTMLLPLVHEFGDQVQFSLYHTPDLRGMTKRLVPPRWNELLGLQHMKVYIFDNAVLISGANLSNDYFTNRQDRYILIEDKPLADFYAGLLERVQEFSLFVHKDEHVGLHSKWKLLPYEGSKEEFIQRANERISDFIRDAYQRQQNLLQLKNKTNTDVDTWIFPLVEMGQIGIHHDSVVTKRLLSTSVTGSRLKLATGYFNLTQDYMDTITNSCAAQCSILMAHPNANGFQGAKGVAGGIPAAYTLIARRFYENLVKRKQEHRVNFFEYEKPGWTYHAKGLWYYLPDCKQPNMTLIGSSNFGERSVNRDLESQVCLVTTNSELSSRLQTEVERLYDMAKTAEREISLRTIPRWVQAVVRIFKNFF